MSRCEHPNHGSDDHECGNDPCKCRLLDVSRTMNLLAKVFHYDTTDCEVH